jgi:beta-ribofuranosylaminobenzene 5'-phosphate synthase
MSKSNTGENQLRFDLFPRLHVTLINMGNGGYRTNGGVGFAIGYPITSVEFKRSTHFQISDKRKNALSSSSEARLSDAINRLCDLHGLKSGISVKVTGDSQPHFGFGTGTSLRLACIEALFILNGIPYTPNLIISSSGRGGTSGIGVHTYFNGGLVLDLGKPGRLLEHLPSNQQEDNLSIPLLLKHSPMPEWKIGICIPAGVNSISESQERSFFKRVCPISEKEVHETLYHVIFGLQAAVAESDFSTFCNAISAIQKCRWKHEEREQYGPHLRSIEEKLYKSGASAVGMSSMGPTLYFFAPDIENVLGRAHLALPECNIIATNFVNHGREIINA